MTMAYVLQLCHFTTAYQAIDDYRREYNLIRDEHTKAFKR